MTIQQINRRIARARARARKMTRQQRLDAAWRSFLRECGKHSITRGN